VAQPTWAAVAKVLTCAASSLVAVVPDEGRHCTDTSSAIPDLVKSGASGSRGSMAGDIYTRSGRQIVARTRLRLLTAGLH
jgi:hypothetical protein